MKTTSMLAIAAAILVTGSTTSVLATSQETQAQLQTEARVTQAVAEKTALAKVPNGKIKSGELEREHGKLVWSFDISMPHSKNITEVQVDAKTGKIAAVEIETPKDQAKEKATDKEEKK
jgi:uncharacterized membrane protein YkoI